MNAGVHTFEVIAEPLWLASGEYYLTAAIFPNLNVVSFNQYYDIQWKRWVIAVYREGFLQSATYEQPVSYHCSALAATRAA
jgi:hypothetical protein